MSTALIQATDLSKTYRRNAERVHALREVDLALHPGEMVALVGPSGSGKSTLLNVLCGWERPESGTLTWGGPLAGQRAEDLSWGQLALIPQALGLLEDLTVEENIALPTRLTGRRGEVDERVAQLMGHLGIGHLARRYPRQASLGEQQRCCVARALSRQPTVILADEPTAHQDAGWTDVVFEAFRQVVHAGGVCLIATHNPATWRYADRVVSMNDGVLVAGAPVTAS